ncbi:MAG: beta-L-arabinofuranosidase domain-containing protein [Eubacteriales bacterium]
MKKTHSYAKLKPLKLGSITPRGWLREQLLRNKDGMGGHLDELEPRMIATPYTTKETEPRWGEARKAGWGAEISGNYWTGLIELAFTLNDPELIAKTDRWVSEVLAYQRPDGYLGTYTETDDLFDDYNAWGTSCGMNALLAYYDATGQEEVLNAVYRCMIWFCENWTGDKKTRYAGIAITSTMAACYHYTGDVRLTAFCEDYYDYLSRNDLFSESLYAMLADTLHYNASHGAGYVYHISRPAELYAVNGQSRYLKASLKAYDKAKNKVIQKTGGVTCESEYLAPIGSNVETEYCGFAMYNKSLFHLSRITGNPVFADDMERVFFNGTQGARKKDEKAIGYLSSPNQIFATSNSSYADGQHQVYAPCVPVACCPVMSVRILPEFIAGTVFSDDDKNLYFAAYAPISARFDGMAVTLDTLYPFGEKINFQIKTENPAIKTLFFRIPEWCENAQLYINDKLQDILCEPKQYASLRREWYDGDTVTLLLPMKVKISQVDDSDRSSLKPLAFEYGPLLFALPIPEQWNSYPGSPFTPLPDGWMWYNVTPDNAESGLDVYDNMGMRKYLITYNIAADENMQVNQIEVVKEEPEGYVWEKPCIRLRIPAYKAPYSYPPYPYKTFEPYCTGGKAFITNRLTAELVPFGCTALRIAYIPRADI